MANRHCSRGKRGTMPTDARNGDWKLQRQPSLVEQLGSICDVRLQDLFKEPPQKLGSMNMDELLQSIFQSNEVRSRLESIGDAPPGPNNHVRMLPRMTRQNSLAAALQQDNWNLPHDTGNKTVEEVWRLIDGQNNLRSPNYGSISLGEFLNVAGAQAGGPSSTSGREGMHRMERARAPESVTFAHPLVSAGAAPTANLPSQVSPAMSPFPKPADCSGPDRAAAAAARAVRMKKRKERREQRANTEEEGLLTDKRLVRNRESAARSRQRRKLYTEELELEVAQLKMELEAMRQKYEAHMSRSKANGGGASRGLPLRRTNSLKY